MASKNDLGARLVRLHRAYVTPPKGEFTHPDDMPSLRDLARVHGVPLKSAQEKAEAEEWDLERRAKSAEAHLTRCWPDADRTTAYLLAEHIAFHTWGHLMGRGPEGYRMAMAHGMEIATNQMSWIERWRARCEYKAARLAYDAFDKRDAAERTKQKDLMKRIRRTQMATARSAA